MTPGLPVLKGRVIIAALRRMGFEVVRRSPGSHVQLAHADGRGNAVPGHGDTDIG